ncbi:hypothetical protein H2248_002880 [Termitomyces sp. 'cryptogamus']|nr:hypothetical protein H2248_002880 [Termitomyces sp. 'cryptogamus']
MSEHHSKITDTPYKSATTVSLLRTKTAMQQIKANVDRDIKNTLHTIDTEEFLETIIPAIPTINRSLQALIKDGTYDGTRWKGFPKEPPSSEKPLYNPLAAISNAIVSTMSEAQVRTKIIYVDRHNIPPLSLEDDMAATRPDGAGAHPGADFEELEKRLKVQDNISSRTRSSAEKNKEAQKECAREKQRLLDLYQLWWMCIHVVYEIKVKKTEMERYSAVKQLAAYMHQVLIEQLDRRFVLGFVLLFDELTLVLFDRSGVTMTKKAINIHKKPKIFIRIMTGLSSMSPAQLGWDTSMEIYRPISNDIKPSYTIADKFEGVYGKGRYNIHWLIDVEQGDEVEKYVAVSMISAIRSAEICGRATVVYEVVKFDEKDDPKETYALKRYWRPIRSGNSDLYPSEGKIYEIIDEGQEDDTLKHAIVYHDIKVDDQVDSTFELIRRGMVAERYERPVKPLPASRAETDADAELRADRRDVPEDSPTPTADPSILTPLDRHHMNILMPMGLEIKLFCHLLELLTCFRDFLREEKHGNDKLVLHRDVSAGNVLIFQGKDGSSCGRLMDYDHAKKAENYDLFGTRNLSPSQLETERGLTRPLVEYALKRKVENDILDVALKWFDSVDAIGYIRTAAQFTGLVGENASQKPICATDLGWGPVNKTYKWPDFANREAGPGERTGTLPYMAGDVINAQSLHSPAGRTKKPKFVHEAIHDVESLLWVLVRLCITRKGPGINMRREDELDKKSPSYNKDLREAVVALFEGADEVLKKKKSSLHGDWESFEGEVIAHFHPYFEPLKPYVRRWWTTLILGYKYRAEEFYDIHDHIIRILDEAIQEIGKTVSEDDEATKAEINRRKIHKERLLATFRRQESVTPPLASSPLSSLPSSPQSLRNTPQRHAVYQEDPESPSERLHVPKKFKR